MTADGRFYESERLARFYALSRPPVHAEIWARVLARVPAAREAAAALDVGCGAGLSTMPLLPLTDRVVGVDPSLTMLRHARAAIPGAVFVQARAESLPLPSAQYDLVTAAGSLNYAEPVAALREISRVLRPGGRLLAYDFSTGRIGPDARRGALDDERFRQAFPNLPGYALVLKDLPYSKSGLRLVADEEFDVRLTMTLKAYV